MSRICNPRIIDPIAGIIANMKLMIYSFFQRQKAFTITRKISIFTSIKIIWGMHG